MPIHRMILFLKVAQEVAGTRESTRCAPGGIKIPRGLATHRH
jgi:hypothetical protein